MKSEFKTNANGQVEHWVNDELRATIHPDNLDEYKSGLSEEYK